MPPDISAFEPTYLPNSLPKQMPAAENKKVINPISHEASMMAHSALILIHQRRVHLCLWPLQG